MTNIVISGASRTAMASFQGAFANTPAPVLGGAAIAAAVAQSGVDTALVNELLMGNCLMAGEGQAPARQAGFLGGLPESCGAVTLSKMCASGMKSIMLSSDMIRSGSSEVMVAGGMENMTRAPYLIPRTGFRIGHSQIHDHMMLDGLEDAYQKGRSMGTFAEECAAMYKLTREMQDAFAIESVKRAQKAIETGAFKAEITPVCLKTKAGEVWVDQDESPAKARIDKIPQLKPAFAPNGTITAASSSSINDGAAAVVLSTEDKAKKLGLNVQAKILGYATHAQAPGWFTTAPIPAVRKLMAQLHWTVGDVDLWEINEAFAVVPMALMHDLQVPHEKINVNGGACALGHPIGASGARIVVTLMHALKARGLKRGIAALCIGGGEGTAMAIELV